MNRTGRRGLRVKGGDGAAVPVTVSREVPFALIQSADGGSTPVDLEAEPCYGCPCCAKWSHMLGKLREAIGEHRDQDHEQDGGPVDHTTGLPSCLVCAVAAGAIDGPS